MSSLVNFSGIASGIDSSALIQALLDTERSTKITPLQNKITKLTDTSSSLSDLKGLLQKLSSAAAKFRTVNGSALEKTALSSNESILSASANSYASNGSFSITVNSLARNGVFTQSDAFGSLDQVVNGSINDGATDAARTLSYTVGTGSEQESVDIVLTSTTTVNDVVSQFNASSTKAVMSAVNVGSSATPSYRLVVTSLNEGTLEGEIAASRGAELVTVGIFDPTAATEQGAADADIDVPGIGTGISRSTNSISDVIPGLTLELNALGTASISVSDDAAGTTAKISDFVDAYNDVIKFISENDLISQQQDGENTTNIFGPLANSSIDENIVSALRNAFSSSSTTGRIVNTLADLGISTNRDGTLSFNSSTFQTALAEDSEGVRLITSSLGETLASTNGTIAQFIRFNGLIDTSLSSNSSEISSANSRIATIEAQLAKREESLMKQYARLESLIGQLNSQQNAIATILPG